MKASDTPWMIALAIIGLLIVVKCDFNKPPDTFTSCINKEQSDMRECVDKLVDQFERP